MYYVYKKSDDFIYSKNLSTHLNFYLFTDCNFIYS